MRPGSPPRSPGTDEPRGGLRAVEPPRLARRLLGAAFPPDVRGELLADLDREFREHRLPALGARAARRWYRSQAVRSLPHGLALRAEAAGAALAAGASGDVRLAARTARRSPGVTAAVVGSLGLGIGACVLVWGVVEGVVLHPFPWPESDRLVAVVVQDAEGGLDFVENVSPPEFLDVRRASRTLEKLYAFDDTRVELGTPTGTVSVWATLGWGDPFATLGVRPHLGRGFRPDELEPRGADVMILSHRVWVREFGADTAVVGRTYDLARRPREVVGVMPAGVVFRDADVWRPAGSPPARRARGPDRDFQIVGRIRAGHDLADVDRELGEISRRMAATWGADHPEYRHRTLRATTWTEAEVAPYRTVGLLLLGATVLLLLLITLNVAALLLARSVRRARELSVRMALGAGRPRLVRQLLLEGLVLALLGGIAGAALALPGLHGARALLATADGVRGAPVPGWRLIPLALAVSAGVGVLVSLLPALEVSGRDARPHLRTDGPGTTPSRGPIRRQAGLIAAEVALTVMVLAGGAVLGRAVLEVARADPGFDTSHLLTLRLSLPGSEYGADEARAFFELLQERVSELPGVRAAGVASAVHPSAWPRSISVNGSALLEEAAVRYATPAYLATLGVEPLRGPPEAFSTDPDGPPAALVNRTFARRHGGEEAVLGTSIEDVGEETGRSFRVVGVVEDLPNRGLFRPPAPEVVLNHHQARASNASMRLVVRTGPATGPMETLPGVRAVVRDMDPHLPLLEVGTVEGFLARETAPLRIATWALVLLSLAAGALAALGVAAVVAFGAARRRREIGLRRALGAGQARVRREMMGGPLRAAAAGAAVGSLAAVLAALAAGPSLPPPATAPPLLVLGVLPPILAIAALAAYLPAARASRADPREVMRAE